MKIKENDVVIILSSREGNLPSGSVKEVLCPRIGCKIVERIQ